MTTYTAQIVNGQATIQIDTTGMNEGAYDVATSYAQNNKYTNANTSSILTLGSGTTTITDPCTTNTNWLSTDTRPTTTTATIDGTTAIQSITGMAGKSYWKYPLLRGAEGSLEFKIYLPTGSQPQFVFGLGTLDRLDSRNDNYHWIQYVKTWGYWQIRQGATYGSSLSTNTWHTVKFELNQSELKTYVNGTLLNTSTLGSFNSNPYWNDYFFLQIGAEGEGLYVRDVVYTTDSLVSDSVLSAIRSAHLAQF